MLLVRCVLALVALVSTLLDKSILTAVIIGFQIWRWKEEWMRPVEPQNDVERAQFYAAELKKWRVLMAINAVVSLGCFLIALIKGVDFGTAANNLTILAAVVYWIFDRARAIVLLATFFSIVALLVTVFGPFEVKLR